MEREELKVTLMAVQDSAAVQILLEACLFNEDDKVCAIEFCKLSQCVVVNCCKVFLTFLYSYTE